MYPMRIAKDLSRDDEHPEFGMMRHLQAYRRGPRGAAEPIRPIEWDRIRIAMDALSMELDREGLARAAPGLEHPLRDRIYEERARRVLPPGVFVWFDEFEAAHQSHVRLWEEERPGDLDLILNPMLSPAERAEVMQGFAEDRREPKPKPATQEPAAPVTAPDPDQSDIALGRSRRAQLQGMAERRKGTADDRSQEWARWHAKGAEIRAGRKKPISNRALAPLVKAALTLPDSTEIIRRKL